MKYINTYEKYIHTNQDKIDDMTYIQEFAEEFEKKFEYRLNLDTNEQIRFRSFLGFGADKYYHGEIVVNTSYYKTKRTLKYKVRIETDINPAGITNENDIGRTFVIDFDVYSPNQKIPDFYGYERSIDDIIERFHDYVITKLNIKTITEEEKKEKEIKKTASKYNL